jgi:hypothetical protein
MEKQLSTDLPNINSQNALNLTDSQNSDKSEPGSRSIIHKSCNLKSLSNDKTVLNDSHPRRPSTNLEQRHNQPHEVSFVRSSTPESRAPARDVAQEAQPYHRRIPLRTKSTPDLTNKKASNYNFHVGIRRRRLPHLRSQSKNGKKSSRGNKLISTSSQWSSELLPRIRTQPPHNLTNIEPRPAEQGTGVFGLLSRLTSLISSRTLESLDEQVLNDFNMEVGTVASRVDMWRQKLEDEQSSIRSHTRSVASVSARPSYHDQAYTFISNEIQHLLQMTTSLTSSLFGSFSWGFFGMEDRLMVLLQMGSKMVFPVIEVIIMNIWRMLREFLNLHVDDTQKVGGLRSVIDAINSAFSAIRSLIHLGTAYRNAQEPSDSDYTGNSRSQLTPSADIYNLKEEDQKYD